MFEALGGLAKSGVIDRNVACDVVALIVVQNWDAMLPLTTYVRRNLRAPALWENFEYLARLSKRFIETHPAGAYPPDEPRPPEDASLIRALAGDSEA
jgi:hypothetical protein